MNLVAELDGVCHRCGSSRLSLSIRDRQCYLPTCNCKQETLNNMLNAILNALDTVVNEPRYDEAKLELASFIEEFGDDG